MTKQSTTETTETTPTGETVDVDATNLELDDQQAQSPQTVPDTTSTEAEAEQEGEQEGNSREAAKYRRRLREAETQRDALSEQVAALQRSEVNRLAEAAGVKPSAVWAAGAALDDLLTDAGTVDAELVATAVDAARAEFGITTKPSNYSPAEGKVPSRGAWTQSMEDVILGR